jgi:cytochrome b involved in lipid metabolism
VYNLTGWVGKHPGGKGVIVKMCGKNGTALFNSQHRSSRSAKAALSRYKIGTVR